jgi:hypothetical protein
VGQAIGVCGLLGWAFRPRNFMKDRRAGSAIIRQTSTFPGSLIFNDLGWFFDPANRAPKAGDKK